MALRRHGRLLAFLLPVLLLLCAIPVDAYTPAIVARLKAGGEGDVDACLDFYPHQIILRVDGTVVYFPAAGPYRGGVAEGTWQVGYGDC